jgi:hypothetical protein
VWINQAVGKIARRVSLIQPLQGTAALNTVGGPGGVHVADRRRPPAVVREPSLARPLEAVSIDDIDEQAAAQGRRRCTRSMAARWCSTRRPTRVYALEERYERDATVWSRRGHVAAAGRRTGTCRSRGRGRGCSRRRTTRRWRPTGSPVRPRAGRAPQRRREGEPRPPPAAPVDVGRAVARRPVSKAVARARRSQVIARRFPRRGQPRGGPLLPVGRRGPRPAGTWCRRPRRDPQARRGADVRDGRGRRSRACSPRSARLADRGRRHGAVLDHAGGAVATIKTGMTNGARWSFVQAPRPAARGRSTGQRDRRAAVGRRRGEQRARGRRRRARSRPARSTSCTTAAGVRRRHGRLRGGARPGLDARRVQPWRPARLAGRQGRAVRPGDGEQITAIGRSARMCWSRSRRSCG